MRPIKVGAGDPGSRYSGPLNPSSPLASNIRQIHDVNECFVRSEKLYAKNTYNTLYGMWAYICTKFFSNLLAVILASFKTPLS